MKKQLFKSSLSRGLLSLFFLLAMVGNAWGVEEAAYTLTPATGTNNSYTGNCDVTISGITWNVAGNSQQIPWRIGGKASSSSSALTADRAIYSKTAITDNISSVVVTNGTATGVTVNSFKLIVSTAANGGGTVTDEVSGTFTASGTTTFTRPEGHDWSGKYYKFVYNITISATNNKFVQFSGAVFNKEKTGKSDPSFSIADVTANVNDASNVSEILDITTDNTDPYSISYESDDTDVAEISDGVLYAYAEGSCTITATMAATTNFNEAQTTFNVTVTAAKTLSSIALSGTPTKTAYTVGECFDPAGITVTANYSDGTNEDITSSATFYGVDEALTVGQTSFETYATYKGVDSDVQNYTITVSKKTPAITIANMSIGIGDEVTVSATTTPAEASLTYTITEGSEYITLNGSTVTGVAVGTATVRASYAGNAEYDALNKDFTVTVSNLKTATKDGFTTGDNSGSHNFTDNTDISFEAFQGGASTAPALPYNTSYLRLYQNGGYITISGVKGVKIQSITITTGSTYDSTTVGYCVDDKDAPTTGKTVAKNSEYTINGLNNQSVSIYCLATDNKARLDIASIVVKYTKEEVTLSSIALSGEYETSFIKNAAFNHTGAVVTATYSDGDKQDVTSSAVFSEPDMTTVGEKTVTISYTFEGVEKTTSYTINVAEEIVTEITLSGTYTKVFKTTDTFSHEGVVVTATYNSGRSTVVEDAEFSTPDLTTTGTKTVTVTYAEKQASYDIKVIPATAIFFESFDGNDGTGGNDDKWSGAIATNDIVSDNTDWTFASAKGAKECAKFGTGSAAGSAETPAITLTGAAKITFKAAAWNGNSEATTLNLSATSGTLSESSVEMAKGAWTEYTVYLTGVETSTQITFAASQSSNNRFFLDEVLVETIPTTSATLVATDGTDYYATFSKGKATLFLDETTTVYTVKVDDDSKLVLTEVTNKQVPANTGVLLKSSTTTVNYGTIDSADDSEFEGNMLKPAGDEDVIAGYMATENPDCLFYKLAYGNWTGSVETSTGLGFWWGQNNGDAFRCNANTAYLAVPKSTGSAKGFVFGDETTGITTVNAEVGSQNAYNLAGQRVNANAKGIVIINGRKYINK